MTLQVELEQTVEAVRAAVPAEIFNAIGQSIADLKATGLDGRALSVGDKPTLPPLKGLDGSAIDLKALVAKGPLVLTFYRGGWCPYCNVQLRAFSKAFEEIAALGASIIAITPELPQNAEVTAGKTELPFPIAIDSGNAFARAFGLVFSLPTELQPQYRQIGIDLELWNGDSSHELPIPATYVVAPSGVISWAFVEANFTQRADPVDIVAALKAL